jgi:hypothetical protein
MDERRQLPRWEVKKESNILWGQSQSLNRCIIEDLHLKGMCLSSGTPLPRQEPLRMSFAIGSSLDSITVEARIPWSREVHGRYVYGLSFSKVDDEDKDRIYQYINTNCFDQFKEKWWAKSS